ncbi:hypothetical protein [Legionella sp.]|uniref:hypothetical protein n=1 Tax=Legionella sp. TaxID=459 RepID=UPI003CB05219
MLQAAESIVVEALKNPKTNIKSALNFFHGADSKKERYQLLNTGLECLQKEIERQQEKIASLQDCLPPHSH